MLILIITWLILFFIMFIHGFYFFRFGIRKVNLEIEDILVVSIWLGILISGFFLLVTSVFSKVHSFYLLFLFVPLLSNQNRKSLSECIKGIPRDFFLFGFLMLIPISYISTIPVVWFDTGAYHYGLINWLSKFGTVNGLSLLFANFGFTSSWFALPAPFNISFMEARSNTIFGGFAIFLYFLHFYSLMKRVCKPEKSLAELFLFFYYLCLLPVILLFRVNISPSPDLPLYILPGLIFFLFMKSKLKSDFIFFGLILSILSLYLKLSAVPLVAGFGFLVFISKQSLILKLKNLIFASLLLFPLLIVNYKASGCPLYPSTIFCLEFPWTLKLELIKEVADSIHDIAVWNPSGRGVWPAPTETNFLIWLKIWINAEPITFFYTILSIGSIQGFYFFRKDARLNLELIFIAISGIAFLFLKAPTMRFGLAYLVIMPSLFFALIFMRKNCPVIEFSENSLKIFFLLFLTGFGIYANFIPESQRKLKDSIELGNFKTMSSISRFLLPPKLFPMQIITTPGSYELKEMKYDLKTVNGFSFYKPETGLQCWDAFPCSGNLSDDRIRLYDSNVGIESGFKIRD